MLVKLSLENIMMIDTREGFNNSAYTIIKVVTKIGRKL